MTNEEYLKIFHNIDHSDNINENQLLHKKEEKWESLNETPNNSQYDIRENVNDGWDNSNFQVETRINGLPQQNINSNYQYRKNRKTNSANLNGLDQFVDDNVNEVNNLDKYTNNVNEIVKQPQPEQFNESLEDQDVVSVEMFERMGSQAMMIIGNKLIGGGR